YALQAMTKEEFIEQVTEGLTTPPPYFFKDSIINRTGYEEINGVMKRNLNPLTNEEFEREIDNGALVLDTRTATEFQKGFIKGSINIGLEGMYAVWAGTLLDIDRSLLIITEEGREEESIMRLARVGYENIKGYLKDGMKGWIRSGRSIDVIESIAPEKFAEKLNGNIEILDVRRQGEYEEGQLEGAINIPLDALPGSTDKPAYLPTGQAGRLDKSKKYYVHCLTGYRSMAGCSILKARGFDNLINIAGGMEGMKKAGVETVLSVSA
ncbi:rhodanese-like domain-containing protein, partial [bacterium AH-315-M05]|nr:rhodanese-like domain-containing protein [bacterium AH-315-M05]